MNFFFASVPNCETFHDHKMSILPVVVYDDCFDFFLKYVMMEYIIN